MYGAFCLNLTIEPEICVASTCKKHSFFIVGERCSGTNYLQALIAENTELSASTGYGWKHGFPMFPAVAPDTVVFVIFRNALDWVRSMYGKPWHASPKIQSMNFRDFVRCQWNSIVDIGVYFELLHDDPCVGEVLQYDRHPISGRPFKHIIDLRNNKMSSHLGLRNRDLNVVLCTHEHISREPELFLRSVSETFSIEVNEPFSIPSGHFGWPWPEEIRVVALPPKGLEPSDKAWVLENLDISQERLVGYRY